MSNKWVKIDNDYFEVENIEAQLTIAAHGTISILFNNDKRCNDYLSSWFDESIHKTKSQYIRNISCNLFDGIGCFIKTIDFNPVKNNIYVEFSCDYITPVNISERRDDKINQLLNQTYKK